MAKKSIAASAAPQGIAEEAIDHFDLVMGNLQRAHAINVLIENLNTGNDIVREVKSASGIAVDLIREALSAGDELIAIYGGARHGQ